LQRESTAVDLVDIAIDVKVAGVGVDQIVALAVVVPVADVSASDVRVVVVSPVALLVGVVVLILEVVFSVVTVVA
jgi:hypothetical protein